MNTKDKTKQNENKFNRFEKFVREIVHVPKEEILKREKAEKQKKEAKKV